MVLYGIGTAYIGHASARFIRRRPVADDMEIEFVTYATIRDAVIEKRLTREFSDGTTVKETVLSDGDTVGLAPGLSGGSRPEVSA